MEPTSLSATALQVYMDCPAKFKVQYIDKVRISSGGGTAGDMGSLIHAVLELWVMDGQIKPITWMVSKLKELAPNYGIDAAQVKIASKMIEAWRARWDEPQQKFGVLQAEVKETFPLKVQDANYIVHEVPVTFIWDRVDELLDDGSIRVVDYKSWMKYMTADEIFHYLQCRLYALAAAIKYKDLNPPYIWVQLDQLRYGLGTAVRFTRDDIREIWQWLRGIYLSILEDDGKREIVGEGCRWCPRSPTCVSFRNAVAAGTVMSYTTPEEAALAVAEINAVLGPLQDNKAALLAYLESYLQEQGHLEERFESNVSVKITPKRQRTVDHDAAVQAIGPEMAARYGKLGVTVIDELLEGNVLDDETKDRLRAAVTEGVTTSINARYVK